MLKTPLGRYRVMAYVVGVGLIILVFVGVPLKYAADWPYIAQYVGMLHGILYIVYCLTCVELAVRYRLPFVQLVLMAASGFVPVLAFVMERKTIAFLDARAASTPAPAAGVAASAD